MSPNIRLALALMLLLLPGIPGLAQSGFPTDNRAKYGIGFGTAASFFREYPCLDFSIEANVRVTDRLQLAFQATEAGVPTKGDGQLLGLMAGYRLPLGSHSALSFMAGPNYGFTSFSDDGQRKGAGFSVAPRLEAYGAPGFCFLIGPFANVSRFSQIGIQFRFLFGHFRSDDESDHQRRDRRRNRHYSSRRR